MVQKENMPGMMYVEFGYVEGPIIRNQIHYLTMLHELGHVYHGHTQGRPPHQGKCWYFQNGVLHSEAEAWMWALDEIKGKEEIEELSRTFMWDYCLGSYYQAYLNVGGKPGQRLGNGNRHHVEFSYDEPDFFFREAVIRIQGNRDDWRVQYRWVEGF
jgi:hypothetical protein